MSAISHINSNINDELREKINVSELVERFVADLRPKLDERYTKLVSYVEKFSKKVKMINFKNSEGDMPQGESASSKIRYLEDQEIKMIEREEYGFLERKNLIERNIKDLQDRIEDREIIYRAIYKQMTNQRTLNRFLEMKTKEMERENKRLKEDCEREISILKAEQKNLGYQKEGLEGRVAQEEAKWLHQKHQAILDYEKKGRIQMSEKAHEILIKFLRGNSMEERFRDKEKELVAWILKWTQAKKEVEEAEILADRGKLMKEIERMESELKRRNLQRDKSGKNGLADFMKNVTKRRNDSKWSSGHGSASLIFNNKNYSKGGGGRISATGGPGPRMGDSHIFQRESKGGKLNGSRLSRSRVSQHHGNHSHSPIQIRNSRVARSGSFLRSSKHAGDEGRVNHPHVIRNPGGVTGGFLRKSQQGRTVTPPRGDVVKNFFKFK